MSSTQDATLFEVAFDGIGYTDDANIDGIEATEADLHNLALMVEQRGGFPAGVRGIKSVSFSKDEGFILDAETKIFAGVRLIIEARDEDEAASFPPPESLLDDAAAFVLEANCMVMPIEEPWEALEVDEVVDECNEAPRPAL